MHPQLIVDCGGRILSALIVTAEGLLLPCSQEVRQTAMRHVGSEIAFDRRVTEHSDFLWDEALESLSKVQPHQFFQRVRRIGLRRPWDADFAAEALHLASPLAVLSSATALADPAVEPVLATVGVAMLDALLDPVFAFLGGRQFSPPDIDAVAVVPGHTGRHARLALQKVFRRRGFRRLTIVSREIAAAMALVDTAASECAVWDVSDQGLHLHRVALGANGEERRFTTVTSTTIRALSWSEWVQRIAAAIRDDAERRQLPAPTPSMLERALTAFLTGAPSNASWRLSHALLQSVLGDEWSERQRIVLVSQLSGALSVVDGGMPTILIGEICAIDSVRRLLLDAAGVAESPPASDVPVLDRIVRGVAAATLWLRDDASRRVVIHPSGSLRINTFRNEAAEILSTEQLPEPGENCHVRANFAFRGATESGTPFLVHLLWGADRAPEGNATVCAMRVDRRAASRDDGVLRVAVHLRRSRGGRRLNGSVDVRGCGNARSHFTQEFPLFPSGGEELRR